jgi:hypothetical protein
VEGYFGTLKDVAVANLVRGAFHSDCLGLKLLHVGLCCAMTNYRRLRKWHRKTGNRLDLPDVLLAPDDRPTEFVLDEDDDEVDEAAGPDRNAPEQHEAPADHDRRGLALQASMRRWFREMVPGRDPFRDPLRGITVGRPSPPNGPWWPGSAVRPSHELETGPVRTGRSGAAGSRTRVSRSQCAGLYVRRFRMISDVVLRYQAASTVHTTVRFPPRPGGRCLRG